MKASYIRAYNGRSVPLDHYSTDILERIEQVAQSGTYGFLINASAEATVTKTLDHFSRDNSVDVHGVRVAVTGDRTVYVVTLPESHRRHLSYRLHDAFPESSIVEFEDTNTLFTQAAPYASIRNLCTGRRPKSRLLLAAAK